MNTDLFEIIRTTRSMRRLKPDPVPPALIQQILEAGTAAANGGNMQTWRFLVIRDPAIKADVAQWYRRAWHEVVGPHYQSAPPPPGTSRDRAGRMLAAAEHLADHLHEAPVWIVPCLQGGTHTRTSGSSIYPAVQNMLLAARALGLGATLTTLYLLFEKESEPAVREGVRGRAGSAGRNSLVRHPADRLPVGKVRTGRPHGAGRCGVRRSVGRQVVRGMIRSRPGSVHEPGGVRYHFATTRCLLRAGNSFPGSSGAPIPAIGAIGPSGHAGP
jgi:nitroreductase